MRRQQKREGKQGRRSPLQQLMTKAARSALIVYPRAMESAPKPHHFETRRLDRLTQLCREAGVDPAIGLAADLLPLNKGVLLLVWRTHDGRHRMWVERAGMAIGPFHGPTDRRNARGVPEEGRLDREASRAGPLRDQEAVADRVGDRSCRGARAHAWLLEAVRKGSSPRRPRSTTCARCSSPSASRCRPPSTSSPPGC